MNKKCIFTYTLYSIQFMYKKIVNTIRKYMPCPEGANVFCFLSSLPLLPRLHHSSVWLAYPYEKRFRRTQHEDDRGPLCIQSSLPCPYSFPASYMLVKVRENVILIYKDNCFLIEFVQHCTYVICTVNR